MYNTLKRQCAHLSPILSGDGASSSTSSSSTSSPPNCAPPPPSAAASISSSLANDSDCCGKEIDVPEMVWKKKKSDKKSAKSIENQENVDQNLNDPHMPSKLRKIAFSAEYARIEKKSSKMVRFRDAKDRFVSTTTLDSTCNETASSFWSDGASSYGFSKYMYPQRRLPAPPPPSPNAKIQQRQTANFPRTNPHAILPKQLSTHQPAKGVNFWPMSESSYSTTTTTTSTATSSGESTVDSVWTKYDNRFAQGENKSIFSSTIANAQRRRILAGLKSFGIKGELLISILLNRGLITITIEEGRNLTSPCASGCCSTYVRLSLMPDDEKRTQCKTELIPFSNRPVFHQTFTVELLPEDYEKRLVISMWHRERANEKSILMGCMSFTIRHMVESNKVVDGWYFLLAPEYGRRKHLAVHKVNMLTYYGSIDTDKDNQNKQHTFI